MKSGIVAFHWSSAYAKPSAFGYAFSNIFTAPTGFAIDHASARFVTLNHVFRSCGFFFAQSVFAATSQIGEFGTP